MGSREGSSEPQEAWRVLRRSAITVFGDPLSMNMPDPDHSESEHRYIVLRLSERYRLLVVCYAEMKKKRESSPRVKPRVPNERAMKKGKSKSTPRPIDEDTMR